MLSIIAVRLHQGMNWYEERDANAEYGTLVIVTYGACVYWINGEKVMAEKGDFLFIPRSSGYYGKSVPTVFHEQYVLDLSMHAESLQELPSLAASGFVKSKAGCYELIIEKLRVISKEWQEALPYVQLRAASLTLEALALWGRELDRGVEADVSLRHVERMKAYMQDHYRGKITKEHLGDFIGRSPNHAATLFRRVTGQTISEYVHGARIRTALYLLQESLLTVTEIADYLGYSDVSYFQRIFKRTTGQTPSAYVKDRPLQV